MRRVYSPNAGAGANGRRRCSDEKLLLAKKLRAEMTQSETLLWDALKSNRMGVRFRRQAVLRGYIADFWCPSCDLIVELDGYFHRGREAQDAERDANPAKHGIHTLRIPSSWVFSRMGDTLALIRGQVHIRRRSG